MVPLPGTGRPESDWVMAGAGRAVASDSPPKRAQPWPGLAPFLHCCCGSPLAIAGSVGMVIADQSPAQVLTPYHELVARLIAKGCTCELLGHEPSNLVVTFSKDQQHWLWHFQTYGSLTG
jgi:hypothetical protein